jgi:protein-disulfide isomerase
MMKKPIARIALECAMYLALCLAFALVAQAVLVPRTAPSEAGTNLSRTPADAEMLCNFAKVNKGSPALIEFMDFQCPPCRAAWPKIKSLVHQHPGTQYRPINFPLQMHPYAFNSAVAFEIARAKGFGSEAFDDLLSGGTELDIPSLNKYLSAHKVHIQLGSAAAEPYKQKVDEAMRVAARLKVHATPSLFAVDRNGTLTEIHDYKALDAILR